MIPFRALQARFGLTLYAALFAVCAFSAPPAAARDGITGCSVAVAETDQGRVYRHTIGVQVPEGGNCRIYIADDKDSKSWKYCALKRAADNPVSETCDDPIDVEPYDVWRVKAVCGKLNSRAYCHRDKPLEPSVR